MYNCIHETVLGTPSPCLLATVNDLINTLGVYLIKTPKRGRLKDRRGLKERGVTVTNPTKIIYAFGDYIVTVYRQQTSQTSI